MFSSRDYQSSVSHYEDTWRVMDDALYRLCNENPDHARRASTCSKLWIIGRTYATGLERSVATKGTQGSSMSQVTDHFVRHATQINQLFSELRHIREPLDPEKLQAIVSVHGRLVRLLCPITRRNQSTRSFASKYMHFHNPAIPIYDNVAATALRKVLRWTNELILFEIPEDADETYGYYVMRFFNLYKAISSAGLPVTVRHVDHHLLTIAESSYARKLSMPSQD